jgi:hypothetical protein
MVIEVIKYISGSNSFLNLKFVSIIYFSIFSCTVFSDRLEVKNLTFEWLHGERQFWHLKSWLRQKDKKQQHVLSIFNFLILQ